ncbi:MAG: DUF2269 family protein [Chloroflexi bacterium]|nr:DUF2269 family protein [Chloroflexota bacterium]MDA1146768.1 DUF2269 family protein [Chloroflexota bacterium]
MTLARFIHVIALLYLAAGVGNTIVPIWRAWFLDELETRALLLSEAQRNYTTWLLPGIIATGISGYFYAGVLELNVVTVGWLVAMQVVWLIQIFVFVPLLGLGLRRVRFLALQSAKDGETSEELRDALADNAPLVFGTLIVITIVIMTWLPIFRPF